MTVIRRLFVTSLAVGLLPAWAQDSNGSRRGGKPAPYSGGGIRGVSASVPDGWLVDAGEAREFQGEAGYDEPAALRPRAVMPLIEILTPDGSPGRVIKAPFPIRVRFSPQADAAIVPATFRVLYGALKIDITERITKFVQVTAQGFSFENARIPVGKHRLILQVQDEKQRVAERELRVEIE